MRTSKPRIARVVGFSLLVSGAFFLGGRWLQGLYGLDPPYRVFYLGFFLQLAALLVPLAAVVWLVIARWRYKRNA